MANLQVSVSTTPQAAHVHAFTPARANLIIIELNQEATTSVLNADINPPHCH